MENLTSLQQGLVNGLIKEFTKINPKPSNGATRFGFDTINECLKEEERFKETIAKHNLTMMKVFVAQLKGDIKEFSKEFGKVLNVELGYKYPNSDQDQHTLDKMVAKTKGSPLENNYSYETELFFVSKTKSFSGSDKRYDYFGDKWMQLSEVLKKIPVQVSDLSSFVRTNKFVEKSDSTQHYFLRILSYSTVGQVEPYEMAKDRIKNILQSKRKEDFISHFEAELYDDAVKKETVTFFKTK